MTKVKKIVTISVPLIVILLIILCLFILHNGKVIPVIMYHGVSDTPPSFAGEDLFMKKSDFEEQMKYIKDHNYETIFADDIEGNHSGKKTVVLTFDDGYADFYTNVLPILKKYNLKANLYVITNAIDKGDNYLNKEQLKEIDDSKLVEIGSHTHNHSVLSDLNDTQIENELKESKEILENLLGHPVKTITYPTGAYNDNVLKKVEKYYDYAFTTNPQIHSTKEFNKHTIGRRGMGRNSSLKDLKKILLRSSVFRFGK